METINQSQVEEILRKLAVLQEDMKYIKENMVETDCFLTEEDKRDLETARQEYERGETTSLEDFEKLKQASGIEISEKIKKVI